MAYGILYRINGSAPIAGDARKSATLYEAGDIVCVYTAAQCAQNPSPGSPHRILVIKDGEEKQVAEFLARPIEKVARTYDVEITNRRGEKQTVTESVTEIEKKCAFYIDETRLPLSAQNALQSAGRAVITQSEFEVAVWDKRAVIPMTLSDRGGVKDTPRGR